LFQKKSEPLTRKEDQGKSIKEKGKSEEKEKNQANVFLLLLSYFFFYFVFYTLFLRLGHWNLEFVIWNFYLPPSTNFYFILNRCPGFVKMDHDRI